MDNEVIEKASRLAEDLKETRAFVNFFSRIDAFNKDETAQNLVKEFDNLRVELMKKQQEGKLMPWETKGLHDLQEQIQNLDAFCQYMQARQDTIMLAQKLEKKLSEALEVPFAELIRPPSRGGCSPSPGGCSTSSGGCDCGCSC